jgi:hypothetical protein
VTTFAPGDSLDVALKQFGPAAIADLVPRLRTLAEALDAAAGAGIFHGALHPRDVLVSDSTTVMTGVGAWPILARAGERLPIRRPYRAPELAETAISAAGDRFSLAALAYEWMTGRRAPSTFVAGDMAPMSGADRAALGRVFARALHADPAERYDTCEAFVADLEEVDVEEAAAAEPESPREAGRSRKRGGRGSLVPVALPLEVAPPQDEDELRLSADEVVARPDLPPFREDPPLREEPDDVRHEEPEPAHAPAAAIPLRPVPLESPSSSLLRDVPPPAARSRGPRVVAGLVLGLAMGIGIGYAVWGRPGTTASSDGAAVTAPAAEESESAAGPAERETPPPASSPQPSTSSPNPTPAPPSKSAPPSPAANPPPAPAPTRAPAAVPTGNLLVRSTPPGATVFIDDERRGVTPLALQNVELGTRRVRVQRDGFTIEERQINLTRSRPSRSVDVRLTRAAPQARPATPAPAAPAARTGSLVIESRPTGASITLNGRQIGTTPMTIDDLEPGSYSVLLELPTFRPIRTTVRVVAGQRARAAASLVSAQEPQ